MPEYSGLGIVHYNHKNGCMVKIRLLTDATSRDSIFHASAYMINLQNVNIIMKRIDVIKKEVCDYVRGLSAERLYLLLSVLEDYRNATDFPEIEDRFSCSRCTEAFSGCSVDDIYKDACIERFKRYCEMMAK